MKAKIFMMTFLSLISINSIVAQDRTTVTATNSEISDNLDLRAIASIFGDASNLEDFENRLNDPKSQISNLDLNNDNQVDYLRVIESVENNVHLVIVQSVVGDDVYQDVATIEIEKDSNNNIQVQVVGDVYMYGNNYIYEPVYRTVPVIYNYFWTPNYVPYYSLWRWRHYPVYYSYWTPFPVFKYRNHISLHININHQYNYVSNRRCQVAYSNYYGRRSNGYEVMYPNRSFSNRNSGYSNRAELEKSRPQRGLSNGVSRNENAPRQNAPSISSTPRATSSPRSIKSASDTVNPRQGTSRDQNGSPRVNEVPRNSNVQPKSVKPTRVEQNSTPRTTINNSPRNTTNNTPRSSVRSNTPQPSKSTERGINSGRRK